MAGIYRRSIGRHSARREPEFTDIRTTPADELSSWLGDDVCTNCGGPAQHGKLFCSEDCKHADATKVAQATKLGFSSTHSAEVSTKEDVGERFRYPCPPSPNLLAQYSTPLKTALTSPALSAHQSSYNALRGRVGRPSQGSLYGLPSTGRKLRSSSHSTISSLSDSNGSPSALASTDPSTPSPAYGATEDESSSDLDANELELPPSVGMPISVMLRQPSNRLSPKTKEASLYRKPSEPSSQQKSPMWYARRPSSTNMPPGVWYTQPVPATTTKVTAAVQPTVGSLSRSQKEDAQATLTRAAAKGLNTQLKAIPSQSPSSATTAAASVTMRRGFSEHLGTRSPPQLQSAASSAGKTMRAPSPASSRTFSPQGTDVSCDRCRTNSNLTGELDIYATSGRSSSFRRGSASPGSDEYYQNRSLRHRHKHSHSAAAGLYFTQLQAQEEDQEADRRRARAMTMAKEASTPYATSPKAIAPESQEQEGRTSHRGRSKARGHSSHRRSNSPPRAAARRLSRAEERSLSPLPISPKSNPISISSKSRPSTDGSYHNDESLRSALPERPSPLALKTFMDGQREEPVEESEPVRGRSRQRMRSTTRDRSPARRPWAVESQGVAPLAQSRRGRANEFTDPGFDDVDLELDGDDERDSASSSPSSVPESEGSPRRGRTMRR